MSVACYQSSAHFRGKRQGGSDVELDVRVVEVQVNALVRQEVWDAV